MSELFDKSILQNMERVYDVTVFKTTTLTHVIDEFMSFENDQTKYDLMKLSVYALFFSHDEKYYKVTLYVSRTSTYGDDYITFTDIKNGDFYQLRSFLHKMYPDRDEFSRMIASSTDVFFEKPLVFKAKSSSQIGKGSTCRGTIPYGEGYKFEVVGMHLFDTLPITYNAKDRVITTNLYDFSD